MNIDKIVIESATEADLSQVFDLVKLLALYEKEPDSVTTTIDEYIKCFNEGVFDVIVAKHNNKLVGMALYYITFSTWRGKMMYLEDFVVQEEYRNMGIGELLFNEYIQISKLKGAKMVKWQVLNWNLPAVKFYQKKGATIEKNWWNGKIIF